MSLKTWLCSLLLQGSFQIFAQSKYNCNKIDSHYPISLIKIDSLTLELLPLT